MKTLRVILLVLDSVGIGATSDAHIFGDKGADTLGHIAAYFNKQGRPLQLPNLTSLGLLDAYHHSQGCYPA